LSPSDEEIIVDGVLNEPAWKKAEHGGGLLEKEPYPLAPMSEETEFAIFYDDENLYVGGWCWDSEGSVDKNGWYAELNELSVNPW